MAGGCVLKPKGMDAEQDRIDKAESPYQAEYDKRSVPDLPAPATWRDVLRRAFLTNGDLEASYFEWKAAISRIPQVADYPNANLAPSFSYMFNNERMKSWDRTTINVGFDPMENLAFPTKVAKAGQIALEDTRAAGQKFLAAKFELQQKVLTAYLELLLHQYKLQIEEENLGLLKVLSDTAADRLAAAGNQQDLLRAQTQYRLAQNELANMIAEHQSMVAMLNGMLARDAQAPLVLPDTLPAARIVKADDAQLIAMATANNPDLERLAREVEGRKDALELARMGYIPDLNPFAAITGNVSQMIGAMVVVPTTIPEIQGRINEMRSMLKASQAMLRQAKFEKPAAFVAALYVMRNSERQATLLEQTILPSAQQAMNSARDRYSAGQGTFTDVIAAQRTLLDIRSAIAEARVEREKRLAEMEAIAGVDIETLSATAATQPTSRPAAQPVTHEHRQSHMSSNSKGH